MIKVQRLSLKRETVKMFQAGGMQFSMGTFSGECNTTTGVCTYGCGGTNGTLTACGSCHPSFCDCTS